MTSPAPSLTTQLLLDDDANMLILLFITSAKDVQKNYWPNSPGNRWKGEAWAEEEAFKSGSRSYFSLSLTLREQHSALVE